MFDSIAFFFHEKKYTFYPITFIDDSIKRMFDWIKDENDSRKFTLDSIKNIFIPIKYILVQYKIFLLR